MSPKQSWLLERLLIPAGILPPALNYADLKYNEESRLRIGNFGFEYFYILDQKPDKINSSAISGKIGAVHAPWPEFEHHTLSNPVLHKLANYVLLGGKRTNVDFNLMAQKSFDFSGKIGAKVVTFHIEFLDHTHLAENLAFLDRMEKETGIVCAMEYDGAYIPEYVRRGRKYLQIEGSYDWMMNPVKMIKVLDQLYPAKNFGICIDTTALIGCNLPIIDTVQKVLNRIVHTHLAGSSAGQDLASEIDRRDIVEVADMLYQNSYRGFITAEINATLGLNEQRLALIHGGLSLARINFLKKKVVSNAQKHIEKSCQYLLENI